MMLYRLRTLPILGIALLAFGLLTACDSALELEPQQSISEGAALSTPTNVEATLVGAYEEAGDYDLYGGQYAMLSDLMADDGDVTWSGTFEEPRQVWVKEILVTNAFISAQWLNSYWVINTANNVLSATDVFADDAKRAQIEGEARFLRAAMLFELVRVYAQPYSAGSPGSEPGVPIVTEPTRGVDESSFVERASVEAVYTQVINDLLAAKQNLPTSSPGGDASRVNTYAASALLAEVYLNQGDYENAAAEASRVIEEGPYSLADTFADVFNGNPGATSEYIFEVRINAQDNADHSLNLFYAGQDNGGRADVDIEDQHVNRYEAGDERGSFFYIDGEGVRRTTKWQTETTNIPVIRLADMYLIRAEANFREGTSVGAPPLDDVNAIRSRAGLSDLSSVTLDDILQERRLELAFEGTLLHDLKRTQRDIGPFAFDAPELVYPIPQRELDANPGLTQNPGYGS